MEDIQVLFWGGGGGGVGGGGGILSRSLLLLKIYGFTAITNNKDTPMNTKTNL